MPAVILFIHDGVSVMIESMDGQVATGKEEKGGGGGEIMHSCLQLGATIGTPHCARGNHPADVTVSCSGVTFRLMDLMIAGT